MQSMKCYEAPKFETIKPRDRHIVTWSPQEDDILREQISIHGTESWTTIAAHFKDKTSRQCRRRWYTYLNADCKKGGWSAEEDMILCEAQKIFGNKWTEIAKVVSGRTDNAVKNRFSTLCKKRAKHEALAKENNRTSINPNNKRVIVQDGCTRAGASESTVLSKKIRTHISDCTEEISTRGCTASMKTGSALHITNGNMKDRLLGECGSMKQQLRPPLAVLVHNCNNGDDLPALHHVINEVKAASNNNADNKKDEGTFLKKNDPKITALIQQAELLSSLALKVNTENSTRSLENAWKELQDFLVQSEENELLQYKIAEMDFLVENFNDLVADFKSCQTDSQHSWRQSELYEDSQGSSEYSTGSTQNSHPEADKTGTCPLKECSINENVNIQTQVNHRGLESAGSNRDGYCTGTAQVAILPAFTKPKDDAQMFSALPNTGFTSPLQMVPLFRSFAEGIPSPEFSDSERHFLLSTLGAASPSPNPNNPSQPPPPCKRALIHNL